MKSFAKLALVLATVVSALSAQAVILIDDFSTGNTSQSINSGNAFFFQSGTMIGGDRVTDLFVQSNAFGLSVSVDVQTGVLSFTSQSGVDGAASIGYGFADVSGVTFDDLNADLSSQTQFLAEVISNDLPAALTMRVRSSTQGALGYVSVTKTVAPGINTLQNITFDFADFTSQGFTSWSDVDQVVLFVDTQTDGDIAFTSLQAVPEPATLALLAGAASLLAARRKRNG